MLCHYHPGTWTHILKGSEPSMSQSFLCLEVPGPQSPAQTPRGSCADVTPKGHINAEGQDHVPVRGSCR